MQNLYICEKPSQARDLARNLHLSSRHEGYISDASESICVTWCMGHLLEMYLPDDYDEQYKRWQIATLPIVPSSWKYHIKKNCKKQLDVITKLIKSTSLVTIATDYDREGESIARLIIERSRYAGNINRLCLTALDDSSIQKALRNIKQGSETVNMFYAALARARADWLVGMNLSRLFTCLSKSNGGSEVVSIGRVMTPTVSLVVTRDQEIANFVSIPFYELYANVLGNDILYKTKWIPKEELLEQYNGYITDRHIVEDLAQKLINSTPVVSKFKKDVVHQNPPLPFDLTSLQQFCNKKFGFSAQKTLDIAQSLYEKHKATTYPRTDCRYLPISMHGEVTDTMNNLVSVDPSIAPAIQGADLSKRGPCFNTSKVSAHHAIIPTSNPKVNLSAMTNDERHVYEIVRRSYIAQFYPPADFNCILIELTAENELFRAKSSVMTYAGWKVLYGTDASLNNKNDNTEQADTQPLPICNVGDQHLFKDFCIDDKKTTPPAHFTEATLLAAMENVAKYVKEDQWKKKLKETDGLGTPATRAEIISNSINRGYLERSGKYLLSTPKSQSLMTVLSDDIKSASMTALWEQGLEKIANGTMQYDYFLTHITNWIQHVIDTNATKTISIAPSESKEGGASKKTTTRRKTSTTRTRSTSTKSATAKSTTPNTTSSTKATTRSSTQKASSTSTTRGTKGTRSTRKSKTNSADIDNSSIGSSTLVSNDTPTCPKCGNPMILRKSIHGEFWGCLNFPKCRGVLSSEQK